MSARRTADDLIAELKQILTAEVVDEDRAHDLLTQLIGSYRFSQTDLAERLGCSRQRIFRFLLRSRADLAPLLEVCSYQSSVLEVAAGMTETQRQYLLQEFKKTGRPYSQAMLRRLKREWQEEGKSPKANKKQAASPSPRVLRTRPLQWQAQQEQDDAFLRLLERAVKKGQRELERRRSK